MGIPGSFGDTKTPTEDQVAVLNALKSKVETSVGQIFDTFEAVSLVTQVVAGTNLRFKVKVGEGASDFCHVTVFQPLPHTGNAPSLTTAETGKSADDAL